MRSARQIVTVSVLLAYATFGVAGQALHLWQCSSAVDACCDFTQCESPADLLHVHADLWHGELACQHPDPQPENSHSDNQPHDSSSCAVCHVLGQAQNNAFQDILPAREQLVLARPIVTAEFYPAPRHFGLRSRAPPAV